MSCMSTQSVQDKYHHETYTAQWMADTDRTPHVSCVATYDCTSRADLPNMINDVVDVYTECTRYIPS